MQIIDGVKWYSIREVSDMINKPIKIIKYRIANMNLEKKKIELTLIRENRVVGELPFTREVTHITQDGIDKIRGCYEADNQE